MSIQLGSQQLWLATGAILVLALVSFTLATLTEKAASYFVSAQISAQMYLEAVQDERDKLRKVTEALDYSEEMLELITHNASDIIVLHGSDGRYLFVNEAVERITGHKPNSLIGANPLAFIHPDDIAEVDSEIREPALDGEPVTSQRYRFRHKAGHYVWFDTAIRPFVGKDGETKVVSVSRDVSDQVTLEQDLQRRATIDPITQITNRATFDELLSNSVQSVSTTNRSHALIYIDLDQFKIINDTCGHAAGDKMLAAVAERLNLHVREEDVLARMGGDEFAVLLYDCNEKTATERCEELRLALAQARFKYQFRYYSMAASFGVVLINTEIDSATTALQHADVACYVAKNKGRNAIHFWHEGDAITNKHLQAMDWVTTLQAAIEHNRVTLHAQAIVPLNQSDSTSHCEVLCTLEDHEGTQVSPSEFVPAAEYFGLASLLDYHIVERTLEILANSQHKGMVSINLSADTVCNHGALQKIKSLFGNYDVDASRICFEVTETATLRSVEGAIELLQGLKDIGCLIALDDFGSGFSSFEHLTNLPVDYVKIDGQFVQNLANSQSSQAIVRGIYNAAQALGIKTVAEWVEDAETAAILKDIGVEYGQGFYLGERQLLTEALGS